MLDRYDQSHDWAECEEEDSPGHYMCNKCYICTCCYTELAKKPCEGEPEFEIYETVEVISE